MKSNYISIQTWVLAAVWLLGGAGGVRAQTTVLYATGAGITANSALWRINTNTGQATLLHQFHGIGIYQGGLAYDPTDDNLYATGWLNSDPGYTRLFVINRFTGAITNFGRMLTGNLSGGGLAIHPGTGVLYGTGAVGGYQSTVLFTINKATGVETFQGPNGPNCCVDPFGFQMSGLGLRNDGTLYANGSVLSGGTGSSLYQITSLLGTTVLIGPHNVGFDLQNSGLAFGPDGTMYSLGTTSPSTTGLYSIAPGNGQATLIGQTQAQIGASGGLAFAPDTPVAQRVALSIQATSTNTVVLSWPTNAVFSFPYVLHQSTNLTVEAWTAVTNEPVLFSGTNRVTLPFPSEPRFFRLKTL